MRTLSVLLLAALPARADDGLAGVKRVVFLGDSNTFAGTFVAQLDCYLAFRFPERNVELLNLGLPSETVSGLSEADHPYPRPNVHDRLAKVLEKTKPDLVVAGYGMNDGIYAPFADERFEKYREGYKTTWPPRARRPGPGSCCSRRCRSTRCRSKPDCCRPPARPSTSAS